MCWQVIWEWISNFVVGSVSLIAVVVGGAKLFGRNLIGEWFNKRNQRYKQELEKDILLYKHKMDAQLEILKMSYGNVFSERISVFKEACSRMQKIETYRQRLAAYNRYPCKNMVDFSKTCQSATDCPKDCICNYKDVIYDMKDYMTETESWFYQNEFFFSLDQFTDYLEMIVEFLRILANIVTIVTDSSRTEDQKALECFSMLERYDMEKYNTARRSLIASFRNTLGVPLLS